MALGITGFEVQKGRPTAHFTAINEGGGGRSVVLSLSEEALNVLIGYLSTYPTTPKKQIDLLEAGRNALITVNP